MKIDRRITNGLAWAGVVLVVGVPTADLLSAQFMGDARTPQVAVIEPEVAAIPTGAVATSPAVKPVTDVASVAPAKSGSAVDNFLQSGKALPSYITGGEAASKPVASTPAAKPQAPVAKPVAPQQASVPVSKPATAAAPTQQKPVEVAALPTPAKVAPIPMPLSMRPKPSAPVLANTEPVLILPDRNSSAVPDRVVAPLPPADVTSADLDDWESGPLSEFLAARQRQGGSSATVTSDSNGFYLDQMPNGRRGDVYVGPADEQVYFVPFGN